MKKFLFTLTSIIFLGFFGAYYFSYNLYSETRANEARFSDLEAEFENPEEGATVVENLNTNIPSEYVPESIDLTKMDRRGRWAYYWKEFSPEERVRYGNVKNISNVKRVGIQAGHWKNKEVPEELSGLKRSGNGAVGGGKNEAEIVLEISNKVKTLLEKEGVLVDLLPATIPPDYFANAFVSIHADGNANTSVSGYKIASPQTDFSRKSVLLAEILKKTYKEKTALGYDENITRRMSAYYAFNWRRYEHALHPMTPAVIVETGFITSPKDRNLIVSNQNQVATGIANGIIEFLKNAN